MKRLAMMIGITIFVGWTIAMLVNYSIYAASDDPSFFSPLVDGILFMAVMFGLYLLLYNVYQSNRKMATIQLVAGGSLALIGAVVLL
ncbi:hypothetical protein [Alkalicoccus luteus]|uniref:Uncharacterized protein n=1 Tax=Alkalicoccus luteus TaxID=1237094 RepID=A0A969PQY4_9BACI|nr:hypothetical protein [Alkalicoccus luteus]NJP36796.1 hypothetical protein [Alkalicoccus luteus]